MLYQEAPAGLFGFLIAVNISVDIVGDNKGVRPVGDSSPGEISSSVDIGLFLSATIVASPHESFPVVNICQSRSVEKKQP